MIASLNCLSNSSQAKLREKVPRFKAGVDSRIRIDPVFEIFRAACKKAGFYISKETSTSLTAVSQRQRASLDSPSKLDVAQLLIHQQGTVQLVLVETLRGRPAFLAELIAQFRKRFEPWVLSEIRSQKASHKEKADGSLTLRRVVLLSFEHFARLLADESTALGQLMLTFKSPRGDAHPIEVVRGYTNALIEAMGGYHKVRGAKLVQHYRPFAEKVLYTKFMPDLLEHFAQFSVEDNRTLNHLRKFFEKYSAGELMMKFGVKPKFHLDGVTHPYEEAIEKLRGMQKLMTPVEKLDCIHEAVNLARTQVLDYCHGKYELTAMDDQLPVLIYVVSQVQDDSFLPQVQLLRAYLDLTPSLEIEDYLLTTVESAVCSLTHELFV